MTNRDRLLQFLYDTRHTRKELLTDILNQQLAFHMTRFNNEELVYVSNGGTGAIVFVFTLRGRFKYKNTVDIPNASSARKDGS